MKRDAGTKREAKRVRRKEASEGDQETWRD